MTNPCHSRTPTTTTTTAAATDLMQLLWQYVLSGDVQLHGLVSGLSEM